MVKAIVILRCNRCGNTFKYFDENFDPYYGNTDVGGCHYCYGGTLFYDCVLEGEEGFDELWRELYE